MTETRLLRGLAAAALGGLAACAPQGFDRPGLIAGASEDDADALRSADRHILVVRHARKIAPDCNAMDCQLSLRGDAMVERLGGLIGGPVDFAFSSAACRTQLTAEAGRIPVVPHQAVDELAAGCAKGETVSRRRSEAFAEARLSDSRWGLVAEHSNTSCLWIEEFAGPSGAAEAGCVEGRLPDGAYGDIYWLYRIDGAWQVSVLPGAFDIDADAP